MKKIRVINQNKMLIMIMNKLDSYGIERLWESEVTENYDVRTGIYSGEYSASDFICEKCRDLEEWLDTLLRYIPGKFINDTLKDYFRENFVGEEYAHKLFKVKGRV